MEKRGPVFLFFLFDSGFYTEGRVKHCSRAVSKAIHEYNRWCSDAARAVASENVKQVKHWMGGKQHTTRIIRILFLIVYIFKMGIYCEWFQGLFTKNFFDRYSLKSLLKEVKICATRISLGKEFHIWGPKTKNELSPKEARREAGWSNILFFGGRETAQRRDRRVRS